MAGSSNLKVVIIGAGPAGCSCAITLLNAGIRKVTLIDASKDRKFSIGESIPPDTNVLFKQLGIYNDFQNEDHEPCYGSCSYWGNHLHGYNDTILSPHGHGWHLDRSKFNRFLVERVKTLGGKVLRQHTYLGHAVKDGVHTLEVDDNNGSSISLLADFVVDASGARGVFARDKGSHKKTGTPLVCLGLRFQMTANSQITHQTHLESVSEGWWYATRIPGNLVLITLYTDAATVKDMKLQQWDNWVGLLNASQYMSEFVDQLSPYDQKLFGFQAASFCLDKLVGEGWMAIGDAASTYDPITSYGIIKSISHGISSAECIANAAYDSEALFTNFENEVHQQYEHYKDMRRDFYQLEQRWPENTFWEVVHNL
ncbi:MAG: NAD(P)/FAD-dependent oxidoreductase [Bacteroidota bacterium]